MERPCHGMERPFLHELYTTRYSAQNGKKSAMLSPVIVKIVCPLTKGTGGERGVKKEREMKGEREGDAGRERERYAERERKKERGKEEGRERRAHTEESVSPCTRNTTCSLLHFMLTTTLHVDYYTSC